MAEPRNQQVETEDTLGSTFLAFFGETEETGGTGSVTRADEHGILGDVKVDAEEAAQFQVQRQAEADAHSAAVQARHEAEAWYYAEEG